MKVKDNVQFIRWAALNNAEWCSIVCEANGASGNIGEDLWSTIHPVPKYYGNIVTLREALHVEKIKCIVDEIPGKTGVKDSFNDLDLTSLGFGKLFDAKWVLAPANVTSPLDYVVVKDIHQLAVWEAAWHGGEGLGIFKDRILKNPAVQFIAIYDGDAIVAGAILNKSKNVVGLSNFFCASGDAHNYLLSCLGAAQAFGNGMPVVGYESGEVLQLVKRAGFTELGPLVVWVREAV